MYAIVHDGAHQYRVEPGQVLRVQLRDASPGDSLTFDQVALVGGDETKIGGPFVDGASVTGTVLREVKGDKLVIRHFRRRKDSRKKRGHRQRFLEVRIDAIDL